MHALAMGESIMEAVERRANGRHVASTGLDVSGGDELLLESMRVDHEPAAAS